MKQGDFHILVSVYIAGLYKVVHSLLDPRAGAPQYGGHYLLIIKLEKDSQRPSQPTHRNLTTINAHSWSFNSAYDLIYSLSIGAVIRTLGLQWASRTLGIIGFVINMLCTLLIKDRNEPRTSKQTTLNLSLPLPLLLPLAFATFTMLGYFVLRYSLSTYAMQVGPSPSQSSTITALFNLGQAFGRPSINYFSDRRGRINTAASTTMVAGILSFDVWTNAKSYGMLIFFALAEGLGAGNFWATIAPLMAQVVWARGVAI
ncbi:hypothetical protein BDV23DRAFT_180960 [Aspergillus alliaceus]|uniref:Major facilitator superfamily (MFS) profile domain-containing protein n=1 Tax=Petromyces alliaceus TaxID=209559 RepID=A0A5N7CFW5_PETAA|nr:hypothetical protein BDV23DRAFT_180960 [Aspergillus alliaceus]